MRAVWLIALSLTIALSACVSEAQPGNAARQIDAAHPRQSPFVKRHFDPASAPAPAPGERWIGHAVCYGPHRDGQHPDGASPTREQLLEDLQIMGRHWNMIRMYGSRGSTETVLELIKEHDLDMKVVVGAWIGKEAQVDEDGRIVERYPEAVGANRAEVEMAIKLANAYPQIVAAVTVGNETQVSWSFHKVRTPVLIQYIRHVRAQTQAPVSTADVFSYWDKPESKELADELDFIVTHIYAMWNQQSLDNAMAWTKEQYAVGVANHPGHAFVIGEAGWATRMHKQGDEAQWMTAEANDDNQQVFYRDFIAWTSANKIPNFFFEAFDENWKGGEHPDGAEKHWGLYNADRTPKKAIAGEQ
jgi:exo-beta-1,3-glucanase (GH17 family)